MRGRRRHSPFQPFRPFPGARGGALATAYALDHRDQEDQLRQAEAEGPDRDQRVEIGELQRIVGNAARHAGEAEEVHREERDVEGDRRQPEMHLTQRFVVHAAGPFRQPVIHAGHDGHG